MFQVSIGLAPGNLNGQAGRSSEYRDLAVLVPVLSGAGVCEVAGSGCVEGANAIGSDYGVVGVFLVF